MREFTRVNRFAMAMLVVMIVGSGIVSTITAWLQIEGILTRYILTYTLQFAFPLCVYFFFVPGPFAETGVAAEKDKRIYLCADGDLRVCDTAFIDVLILSQHYDFP